MDCLDALASDRQYRRALPLDEAMDAVVAEAGDSFDPHIVDILRTVTSESSTLALAEPHSAAKLSTDVRVLRGPAPAAGFEGPTAATLRPATRFHL